MIFSESTWSSVVVCSIHIIHVIHYILMWGTTFSPIIWFSSSVLWHSQLRSSRPSHKIAWNTNYCMIYWVGQVILRNCQEFQHGFIQEMVIYRCPWQKTFWGRCVYLYTAIYFMLPCFPLRIRLITTIWITLIGI